MAVYLGAEALRVHPVEVPESGALTIQASISAKEVVTVSAKTANTATPPPKAP